MAPAKENIDWIDLVKAVCIFLVVYGHMYELNGVIKNLIYSMHLPAFLFVTGYLVGNRLLSDRFLDFTRKRIVYSFNMYAFFTAIAVVLWYFIEARGQSLSVMMQPLLGGLGGVNGPAQRLVHNNGPIWYFPFLIVSLYAAYVCVQLSRISPLLAGVLLLALCFFWVPGAVYWSLDLAPIGSFFIIMGFLYRRAEAIDWFKSLVSGKLALFLIVLAWLFVAYINGSVNLNGRDFGGSSALLLLAGVFGVLSIVQWAKMLGRTGLVSRFLAPNTLFIFCSHFYLVKAVRIFSVAELGWLGQLVLFVEACIITFICAYVSIFVQPYLEKYLKPKFNP